MKNLLLLFTTAGSFILGLVFSLILLYSSPDNKVHILSSSLFSLGSAFYMLVVYYFVSLKKEPNSYTKYLYTVYGIVIASNYIILGLVAKYAPPDDIPDTLAMSINILAAVFALASVVFLYIHRRKRKIGISSFSTLFAAGLLICGYISTLYVMYEDLNVLNASYCYLTVSILVFFIVFFAPINLQSKKKYIFYTFALVYALFGLILALISIYSSPDESIHPLASALFFISFTVTASASILDNQNFTILQKYEQGKLVTFTQIALALMLVLSLVSKIL
jgi:hypothetical protein